MITDTEYKILSLLELGYNIDAILKELNIEEENLADLILDLNNREFITLENKNWVLLEKAKGVLKEKREGLFKRLKVEYMYGKIDKQEFRQKRKELEIILQTPIVSNILEDEAHKKEEKKNCPKCRKENKPDSKYCFKCGEPLNKDKTI